MEKRALNTRNRRKIKRRSKRKGINVNAIIICAIIVIYEVFTFYSLWNVLQPHYGIFDDRTNERITSVWLDDVSLHQTFKKDGVAGLRIWLTNPDNTTEGVVSVRIGEESSGNVLYSQEILATDISDSVLDDYVEIIPEDIKFDNETEYYIEIDGLSCKSKTIKTYVGVSKGGYDVIHLPDDSALSNKMLCMAFIQKTIPALFINWIFVTILIVLAIVSLLTKRPEKDTDENYELPVSLESKVLIPFLVIACVLGAGFMSFDKISTKTYNYEDEDLEEGYVLQEHSSYSQKFTVEKDNFKEIHIAMSHFFDNTATFVVSVQKGQDEVIGTIQSNEMDYVDGSFYSWDISDLDFEIGEEYDLYIFTGFIGEDEEKPVIKRIEYLYSKNKEAND